MRYDSFAYNMSSISSGHALIGFIRFSSHERDGSSDQLAFGNVNVVGEFVICTCVHQSTRLVMLG